MTWAPISYVNDGGGDLGFVASVPHISPSL